METIRDLFLLDPDITFLNHGSFGATPKPVFTEYQNWQRKLELQPVRFLTQDLIENLTNARNIIADYAYADANDLVFIPNATYGINVIANSLKLKPGDEILTTNHEYGACENAWEFTCLKVGAKYIRQPITLPAVSEDSIIDQIWNQVTTKTRLIFISHISSPTAHMFPVQRLCRRAKEAGILTLVDGAHAPGQIDLNIRDMGVDFYTGNFHKWAMAPKGSAFLYTDKSRQDLIKPLIVGWGWKENPFFTFGSRYLDYLQWWGTMDPSAYLSVPAAINFQKTHDWNSIRSQCHAILKDFLSNLQTITGIPSIYNEDRFYRQMAIAPLPRIKDLTSLKKKLYTDHKIEVPLIEWEGQQFIRISVQGYNTTRDLDILYNALQKLLPGFLL